MEGKIVKIDYQTVTQMQPIFQHKNIFADLNNLPEKQSIIKNAEIQTGRELTALEKRDTLQNTGLYKTDTMIVKDYGTHLITLNLGLFVGKADEEIFRIASGFDLYLLASKIFLIILGKAYSERKWTDLRLSKKEIIGVLGYESSDKYVYERIKKVFEAFYHCDYVIFESSKKNLLSTNARTMGRFLYNLSFEHHDIVVSVNQLFIGCVANMLSGQIEKDKIKNELSRGYVNYPMDYITSSTKHEQIDFDFGNYLIAETGNPKLNNKLKSSKSKVIAQKCNTLCDVANITAKRPDKKISRLISAIENCELIEKVTPDIKTLKQKSSKDALETVLHIQVRKVTDDFKM